MIAAFARAARVLDSGAALGASVAGDQGERHLASAERAARFLKSRMWDTERRVLLRRYRQGHAAIDAYAEDYAYLIFGLLELFSSSSDAEWLAWAIELQRRQDDLFWDATGAGWYSTTGTDASVLVRLKEDYDGAEPSASGVGAWNLLTFAHLVGDATYQARADDVFRAFGTRLLGQGRALPMMSAALCTAVASSEQIVIVGGDAGSTETLWHAAHRRYRPFAHLLRVAGGEQQERLATLLPWVREMSALDGKAAAYVCHNFTCDRPTTDPAGLA